MDATFMRLGCGWSDMNAASMSYEGAAGGAVPDRPISIYRKLALALRARRSRGPGSWDFWRDHAPEVLSCDLRDEFRPGMRCDGARRQVEEHEPDSTFPETLRGLAMIDESFVKDKAGRAGPGWDIRRRARPGDRTRL